MNADDLSSGEENSQSYNSDSSSIPSYLSDFEVDPSEDPPFFEQRTGFGGFSLLLSCERRTTEPALKKDGAILRSQPEGTTPLSTCGASFLHNYSSSYAYTSASTTLSTSTSSQCDSLPPSQDLLLTVAPIQRNFDAQNTEVSSFLWLSRGNKLSMLLTETHYSFMTLFKM
jgi:hypothetical protein